mmetsp:Transcript_116638/g.354796  ORF Transcript_116638/g.354796 Transcript_116638/m.354796 type:complete len:86 (+) Transcript_116638:95-352(+)
MRKKSPVVGQLDQQPASCPSRRQKCQAPYMVLCTARGNHEKEYHALSMRRSAHSADRTVESAMFNVGSRVYSAGCMDGGVLFAGV